jgi:hypothetical protein
MRDKPRTAFDDAEKAQEAIRVLARTMAEQTKLMKAVEIAAKYAAESTRRFSDAIQRRSSEGP